MFDTERNLQEQTELAVGTEVNDSHLSQFMCIYSPSTSNTDVPVEIEFTAEVDAATETAVSTY